MAVALSPRQTEHRALSPPRSSATVRHPSSLSGHPLVAVALSTTSVAFSSGAARHYVAIDRLSVVDVVRGAAEGEGGRCGGVGSDDGSSMT